MKEDRVDELLRADPDGQPWRPTPAFFDSLQAEMSAVDAAPLRIANPWQMAAAAGVSAMVGAGLWWLTQSPPLSYDPGMAVRTVERGALSPLASRSDLPTALRVRPGPSLAKAEPSPASVPPSAPAAATAHQPASGGSAPSAGTAAPTPAVASAAPSAKKKKARPPVAVASSSPKSASRPAPSPKPAAKPSATTNNKTNNKKSNDLLSALNKPKAKPSGGGDSGGGGGATRLSAKSIKAKLNAQRGSMARCADGKPGTVVTLQVRLTIRGNGRVQTARVLSGGGAKPAEQSCVLKLLKRMRFDTFSEPNMTLSLPLKLRR